MRVDFPRWEEDPMGWISRAERYFCYYQTSEDSMVDTAVNHLEGDAIRWYNWLEYTHGAPMWIQFKNVLLNHFGPTKYENINGQLAKIRQISTIQEYKTRSGPGAMELSLEDKADLKKAGNDLFLEFVGEVVEDKLVVLGVEPKSWREGDVVFLFLCSLPPDSFSAAEEG
ncbi:hypothetical protein B296_00022272 [Ensete ventricosum]|uniref:Retrotransposon gag domain-containing protein n=1 Tax=Ensete ventricosum TaxID=4639 RepID=A0A427AYH8_ENSVE|nr:hypothetical protein B296_00022272 [Ensete ventricosum]